MVTTSYISCACNRLPRTADWGKNGLVCYAANNSVAIYDPKAKKYGSVLSTLHEHTDRVNVVRWIRPSHLKVETEFLSASTDGTAIIWHATDLAAGVFKATDILRINEPTNICDGIYFTSNPTDLLICTGSINGDFRFWLRVGEQEIEPIQILNFSKKLPIQARLVLLPSKPNEYPNILLLIAMEDSTILLYSTTYHAVDTTNQKKIGEFVKVQCLVGHEDWVTSIDFVLTETHDLLVASGSQDNTIRLWKISPSASTNAESSDPEELKPKKQNFFLHEQEYEIILESIFSGHDAWIYELHWHPAIEKDGKTYQPMKLLSCSLDKTAIIWEPNSSSGIWSESLRVGEVGGNSLGFYGCKFAPDGKSILTHGYHGSLHMWEYNEELKSWEPRTAPSGHYDGVVDLCWDPKGRFLVTASLDQTTRIHAPWPLENGEESWHEIGRPQIHGYDMSCLAMLKPYKFASGAEEKVVRVFNAPLTFKKYLEKIVDDVSDFKAFEMPRGASVPALGLTNKGEGMPYQEQFSNERNNESQGGKDICYDCPPLEEELVRHTLWPELQKLYGHGYEIFSMAARHDGTLLATSSKSTNAEHAAILLWNTNTWSPCQKLEAHQLTVTQLAFSPDDRHILSVSRDRRWSLFILEDGHYKLLFMSPKKDTLHTRIIWCCAWTHDSLFFATGSRDGKIGIWHRRLNLDGEIVPSTDLHFPDTSVTALAFAPLESKDLFFYILAIGFESGCIDIRNVKISEDKKSYEWIQLAVLDQSHAHHLTVKRLAFRPKHKNQQENILQLASCGSDGIVKIHDISVDLSQASITT